MKIIILGSGTFIPELKRGCSNYLIENGNEKIVLDFGRGVINQLLKLKISLYDLDKIFISHMHADHGSEIISFIHFILDNPNKKELKKEYFIYGPKGIKKDIQNMLKAFHLNKHKNLNRIKIKELKDKDIIKINNIKIQAFKVRHGTESLAYRIIAKNKKLCYSGDSAYCKELIEVCKNVDLAILDSTGPKEWKLLGHMTGEEAGKLAQKANIKKLILTHIANIYLNKAKKDAKKFYKRKIIIAKDLMKIKI